MANEDQNKSPFKARTLNFNDLLKFAEDVVVFDAKAYKSFTETSKNPSVEVRSLPVMHKQVKKTFISIKKAPGLEKLTAACEVTPLFSSGKEKP